MSDSKNGSFSYTYSPERQEEVRKIQEKYMEEGEDKLARLRSLDASTTKVAQVVALSIGIGSTLVMGGGMSLVMATTAPMLIGLVVGILGFAGLLTAYPVYKRMAEKKKAELAPEILRLSEELLKEAN